MARTSNKTIFCKWYCFRLKYSLIITSINGLKHLDFDPETGGFYVYTDDKKTKNEFLKILFPIFQDLNLLEKYIQEADRSRIDD